MEKTKSFFPHSCYRCKICYCDEHIKRRGHKYIQGDAYPCPKCNFPTRETKDLSMSSKEMIFLGIFSRICDLIYFKLGLMIMEEKLKMMMRKRVMVKAKA